MTKTKVAPFYLGHGVDEVWSHSLTAINLSNWCV